MLWFFSVNYVINSAVQPLLLVPGYGSSLVAIYIINISKSPLVAFNQQSFDAHICIFHRNLFGDADEHLFLKYRGEY